MTKLLQKAFHEVSKLPEAEQNVFAKWLLEELASDRRWEKTFAESEDVLSKLAEDALKQHRKGRTKPLNIDEL